MLRRVARNTGLSCAGMVIGAVLLWPSRPTLALGVLGGGVLVGLAFWAIAGAAGAVLDGAESGENRRFLRAAALVKFFTRHAILALVAYIMLTALHLDAVGMMAGVTSVVVAAGIEAARPR